MSDVQGHEGRDTVTVTVDNPITTTVTETFSGELKGRTKVGTHTFSTLAGPATVSLQTPAPPGKKVDAWRVTLRGPGGTVVAVATGASGDTLTITTSVVAGAHTIEVEGKGSYSGAVTHLQ